MLAAASGWLKTRSEAQKPSINLWQTDIECSKCNHSTMHTILAAYKTSWSDEETEFSGGETHDFLRCNGCGSGTYRTRSWFSEAAGDILTLHPPRGSDTRQPKKLHEVPAESHLPQVYDQTITAFNAGLFTLAGAGVRLLIEGVCIDQKVNDGPKLDAAGKPIVDRNGNPLRSGSLEGKINGLAEQGFISLKQSAHLHQIRFLGNDAAHQLDIPEARVVGHAIDIVEHLLDQVYIQPEKAERLAKRQRPKR